MDKDLPNKVEIDLVDLTNIRDLIEAINEWLAREYGFATNDYNFSHTIVVKDIEWDTEEHY